MKNNIATPTLLFTALLSFFVFSQCWNNRLLKNTEVKENCIVTDSIFGALRTIDFKSYQKRELRYLLEESNMKKFNHVHFVNNSNCLVSIEFDFDNAISVKIELNSFKKLSKCVSQYSDWKLEDAKHEFFGKITIFNDCNYKNFKHFIYQ